MNKRIEPILPTVGGSVIRVLIFFLLLRECKVRTPDSVAGHDPIMDHLTIPLLHPGGMLVQLGMVSANAEQDQVDPMATGLLDALHDSMENLMVQSSLAGLSGKQRDQILMICGWCLRNHWTPSLTISSTLSLKAFSCASMNCCLRTLLSN